MPGWHVVPGLRPRHGLLYRVMPAQAHTPLGRAMLGPGQFWGLCAGPPGLGLHGHLLAVTAAEDPQSVVVAQASFWWHGGALPVEHGGISILVIRCVLRQRQLAAKPCQFVEQRYKYLLL